VSSFHIFKFLGLALFECIFVGAPVTLCLAQPREREVQRPWRLRTRAHVKILAECEIRRIKLANALHDAVR
jgi:hypothetical protein